LKQQIECGIIWIQNSPTRKMFLKFFDWFPHMINILIIFATQYFEEMLKILISDFLFYFLFFLFWPLLFSNLITFLFFYSF
jgi:hypothetical protein